MRQNTGQPSQQSNACLQALLSLCLYDQFAVEKQLFANSLQLHHFLLGYRDAEEAMLAAAIRASLIEAGEPDTSAAALPNTSQQRDATPTPNKQRHQQLQPQQQAGPQASPFQTSQPEQQPAQQFRQQQKQKEHQHQLRFQEELPDGHGLPPKHGSAAEPFRDLADGMQEPGSFGMVGQGTSQQGSRQASNAVPGRQLRTARSSDGVVGRGNLAGNSENASDSGAGDTADIVWYRPRSSCLEVDVRCIIEGAVGWGRGGKVAVCLWAVSALNIL